MLTLLLIACSGSVVTGEPDPCADGFERGTDGACYELGDDTAAPDDTDTAPVDLDGDGYAADVDCDDASPTTNPGALEVCGGGDEDCDGTTDEPDAQGATEWNYDGDGDGFGGQADTPACSAPAGYVGNADDCDDTRADVHPEAPDDTGDGLDNDCDGAVDEDYDACAESFGEAVWWSSSYDTAGFGADTYPLPIYGNALVCDVTCDAGWLVFEGVTPDGFTSCEFADNFDLPYLPPGGEVRACISISDPGTSSATGTCTAHTSAGDIAIDITWTG